MEKAGRNLALPRDDILAAQLVGANLFDLRDILDFSLARRQLSVQRRVLFVCSSFQGFEFGFKLVQLGLLVGDGHHLLRERQLCTADRRNEGGSGNYATDHKSPEMNSCAHEP